MNFIDAVRRESAALHAAVAGALDAAVPACPGWKGRDLVAHIGEVQWFWREALVQRPASGSDIVRATMPGDDAAIVQWAIEGSAALVTALEETPPDARVWTWAPQHQNAAFVRRRQAHEAAVHRYDAQAAAGSPSPIEPDLAADGVAEFLELHLHFSDPPVVGNGEVIVVRSTDSHVAWTVRMLSSGVVVEDGAATDPTVMCSGAASDLDLALWRRLPIDALAIEGDVAAAERFFSATDLS